MRQLFTVHSKRHPNKFTRSSNVYPKDDKKCGVFIKKNKGITWTPVMVGLTGLQMPTTIQGSLCEATSAIPATSFADVATKCTKPSNAPQRSSWRAGVERFLPAHRALRHRHGGRHSFTRRCMRRVASMSDAKYTCASPMGKGVVVYHLRNAGTTHNNTQSDTS